MIENLVLDAFIAEGGMSGVYAVHIRHMQHRIIDMDYQYGTDISANVPLYSYKQVRDALYRLRCKGLRIKHLVRGAYLWK